MQFFNVSVPLSFKLIVIAFIQRQPTTSSNCLANKDFSLITRGCWRHLRVYNLWHLLFPIFAVFLFFKASHSFKINILSIPTSKSLRQDEVCFEGPAFPVFGFLLLTLHIYPTPRCLMWLVSGPRVLCVVGRNTSGGKYCYFEGKGSFFLSRIIPANYPFSACLSFSSSAHCNDAVSCQNRCLFSWRH